MSALVLPDIWIEGLTRAGVPLAACPPVATSRQAARGIQSDGMHQTMRQGAVAVWQMPIYLAVDAWAAAPQPYPSTCGPAAHPPAVLRPFALAALPLRDFGFVWPLSFFAAEALADY